MNSPALQAIADSNEWVVLWPEITLGLVALLLLVLELVLPKSRHEIIPRIAVYAQVLVLVTLLGVLCREGTDPATMGVTESTFFDGLVALTPLGEAGRVLILFTSLVVSQMASLYFQRQALPRVEFYHLVLVVTAAMMLLVQSAQFVLLFVTLETVTVGFYILVAYARTSPLSLEAGLKYLILGSLSSAILLFGIVLLYGVAGNPDPKLAGHTADAMNFTALGRFITDHPYDPIVDVGVILVLCGISFKIAVVPFQIWVPDVYQGAPTPTTALLAVASKTAGFIVLLNLVLGPFGSPQLAQRVVVPLLSTLAVLTILFGNLAALTQRNVKRIMGLSGIAHAGYILVGVVAAVKGVPWAAGAVVFYLFTYMLGSLAVFGVMAHVAGPRDETQELEHYAQLGKREPFLGGVLAVGLGSLAGIPPLAGFIGKLLIFLAAFQAHLYGLLFVSIFGVVISIYYYFGWMREALFRGPSAPALADSTANVPPLPPSSWTRLALGLLAAATLFIGLYQGFFPDLTPPPRLAHWAADVSLGPRH
jgi:NADH-quinone oxidoreductase subunit N